MNISDGLLILSTLAGPVLAVQAQKWIERSRAREARRQNVFYQLMATRPSRVSVEHVRALNMIDLEFYGDEKFKEVREKWRIYHDHLNEQNIPDARIAAWVEKGGDLFDDLLHSMSVALGYDFDRVQLKRGSYIPRAHGEEETIQRSIRDSLRAILGGTKPFPITVTSVTQEPEALERQRDLQRLLSECLSGKQPLQIVIQPAKGGLEQARS